MGTFSSLRDFMGMLEKQGKLVRVKHPVSTFLEMTEIQTRLLAEHGPAVLFENVIHANSEAETTLGKRATMPVLVNLFGTVERVAMALQRTPEQLREVGEMLAFFKQPEPPASMREAWEMMPLIKAALAMKPKTVNKAPCQEVVLTGDDVDLSTLPIQSCWPNEPAPLITWPLVVTKGPTGKKEDNYNLGIYRMQVTGKNTTLMRWLKHRGGAQHHQRWKKAQEDAAKHRSDSSPNPSVAQASGSMREAGSAAQDQFKKQPLPVAVVLGADPATILAAVTPVPDTLSEYQFAGLLRGSKVELVDCKTVPLKVPAQAEIILEGYVSLNDYGDEGPYGDHTGYYNSVEQFPIFTCTAITMRKDPIYLSTFTSRPPDEPSVLGEALNEVFIPLLQQQFPEIIDFWLPPEGCSYRVAVVSIKKAYAGHAKRVMMGVWSFLRQFVYTKFVIVVDEDINCRDWKDVIWAMSTRMDPVRDIVTIENTPIDYLDFASPISGLGGKLGMDATNKMDGETTREWGEVMRMDDKVIEKVSSIWKELGLPTSGTPIWK